MAGALMLEVVIKMVPFEPDGSTCDVCGDVIYLEGRKPVFVIASTKSTGKKVGELDYKFCQSCGEAIETEMEGGGNGQKESWS